MLRAVHQFMDEQPLIFPDPLALPIIGSAGECWMRDNMAMFRVEGLVRARSSVVIRSRYTEEELTRAVAGGTTQYVVLGAGLDTFAYRRADLADRLTVYEVDQRDTQQWKVERLAEARIAIPANLRFVPVNFNERTLSEGLAEAGFRRDAPALFSWLGVVYYLPRESVIETLRFIAGQQAASQVIFDFAVAESAVLPQHKHLFREFMQYTLTAAAERWTNTWFTPDEIKAVLRGCGFADIAHLDSDTVADRYLNDPTDGLLVSPLVNLISAYK